MIWFGSGVLLNAWVIFILWLGGVLPGFEPVDVSTGAPALDEAGRLPVFFEIRELAFGAVAASMLAYLVAQFCDVRLFHFWKKLTRGKHLWLRNNASTMVSQIVDTTAVILITHFYARALPVDPDADIWASAFCFYRVRICFQAGSGCRGYGATLFGGKVSQALFGTEGA